MKDKFDISSELLKADYYTSNVLSHVSVPLTITLRKEPKKKERKPPVVNLAEEYRLIQQKKSTLSRWERDWVVDRFEERLK